MSLLNCSKCGAQVSSKAETCRQCGSPIRPLSIHKKYWFRGSIFLVALFIIMILVIFSLIHRKEITSKSSIKDISVEAVNASREFVARKLITPSTAKYPIPSQAKVTKSENNQYTVISYVDAQNSSGAMLRKNYECVVRYEPENDRWYLVKITIEK
jgi:hypothetical protein